LAEAFLELIPPERFVPGRAVESIDLAGHLVTLDDGTEVAYAALLSTMPLTDLVRLAGEQAPAEIQASAADLKSNTVYTVNIGLEGLHLGPCQAMHWVYFPGDETIFHRLSFPASFSDAMTPDGCVSIQAEVSASPYRPIDPACLVDETLASLVRVGILDASEARSTGVGGRIRVCEVVALEPAYVIYDHGHRDHTTALKTFFRGYDVLTRGRFGEWEYLNMDHAIMSGKRAAEELGSMLASRTRGALVSSPAVS
jgi:protoporphyrinogen oxidase